MISSPTYNTALQKIRFDNLNGKTFLITGATGMIGSCLVDTLMQWNIGILDQLLKDKDSKRRNGGAV